MSPALLIISLLIGVSVIAFGGVYPWTFWPLGIGCGVAAILALLRAQGTQIALAKHWMRWILPPALAAGLQMVPLPAAALSLVAPRSVFFLQSDTIFHAGSWTTLSMEPLVTLGVVAWGSCLAALFVAMLMLNGPRQIPLLNVIILSTATIVAVLTLAQARRDLIYGFWTPLHVNEAAGPFVNRNHLAGWLVLASGCGVGFVFQKAAAWHVDRNPGWVGWVRALTSNAFCQILLACGALLLITMALASTMSRSGFLAEATMCVFAGIALYQSRPRLRSWLVVGGAAIAIAVLAAIASDTPLLAARLNWNDASLDGRVHAWQDSLKMFQGFPVAGTGLGTFGLLFPHFRSLAPEGFLAAHNDYLQLAIEGGLLVAVPVAALTLRGAVGLFAYLRGRFTDEVGWLRAGAAAGCAGVAVQETVEFSLRSPAVAVLFVVCAAVALGSPLIRRAT